MKEVSIVLVRHTLQQGNVVSFQHDPPWETETEGEVDQKSKTMDGKRYSVSSQNRLPIKSTTDENLVLQYM